MGSKGSRRGSRRVINNNKVNLLSFIKADKRVPNEGASKARGKSVNKSLGGKGLSKVPSGKRVKSLMEAATHKTVVLGDITFTIPLRIYEREHQVVKELRDRKEVPPSYLISVIYDGAVGKACLKLYDDVHDEVYIWYDKLGHKPYFLTDLPPEKINNIKKIVNHESFEGIEVVEKTDLLNGGKKVLTKIITKDPLAVATLRNYVPKAWEAKIKYHNNYIYDFQLIPGMMYEIHNGEIKEVKVEVSKETLQMIQEKFKGEDEETLKLIREWIPIFELKPPKIKRIAFDIEVYTPFKGRVPDPDVAEYPIISISLVSNDGFNKVNVLFREGVEFGELLPDYPFEAEVEIYGDERGLILDALSQLIKYSLILTFNGDAFDIPYLYKRALKLGIPKDLLPFKWTREYPLYTYGFTIDLYRFFDNNAIQNYAFGGKYKEKTLDAIAEALLGVKKVVIKETVSDLTLAELATYNFRDAWLTLNLTTFNGDLVWKLIVLLMRISKMSLEDVCRRGISIWIRNLMYWEHRKRNCLIPNQEDIMEKKSKVVTEAIIKGKKYAGAIVINPIPGVYFNVVVLDYASLYPSIIKRWNLSYETIDPEPGTCKKVVEIKDEKGKTIHTVCFDRPGITSQITGLLRDFRVKIYKKKAKDKSLSDEERGWYDVVQQAMKVFINASYGVFGHSTFPLYAPPVAESVTAMGRYVITSSIKKARELNLKVIYGDTDSLFIWSPLKDKLEELKKWVHENFGLELEVDKVYKYVAFAQKKNYVGVFTDGSIDIKGLMGKKRNTPDLFKLYFIRVTKELASLNSVDDVERVKTNLRSIIRELYQRLKSKDFTLDEIAFKVALSKSPREYRKTTPPHVRAAKQLMRHNILVNKGDIILYVKVKSRDKVKAVQLAKLSDVHIDEYLDYVKSVFEQVLAPFNIQWEEIAGLSMLEKYLSG
ncbi:MAG TPA: DNA-directed DNA polymerase I [Acidilobales archaeon]|nr:DNA-directed DNA polymerase I [Acidilobales archaeon]